VHHAHKVKLFSCSSAFDRYSASLACSRSKLVAAQEATRMRRAGSDVFAPNTMARSHGAGRKDARVWKVRAA
jgi:hypothetical protein